MSKNNVTKTPHHRTCEEILNTDDGLFGGEDPFHRKGKGALVDLLARFFGDDDDYTLSGKIVQQLHQELTHAERASSPDAAAYINVSSCVYGWREKVDVLSAVMHRESEILKERIEALLQARDAAHEIGQQLVIIAGYIDTPGDLTDLRRADVVDRLRKHAATLTDAFYAVEDAR